MLRQGSAFCTAAVIAPKYVLTAAHCVDGPEAIKVNGQRAANVHVPPMSNHWSHDIAVVELGEATTLAPIPVNLDASAISKMTRVRLVGFGVTGTYREDGMIKRSGDARVRLTNDFIESIPGTGGVCFGDSGGPALSDIDGRETIVGVASHINGERCEDDGGAWVRTDRLAAFLAPFLGETKTPETKPDPTVPDTKPDPDADNRRIPHIDDEDDDDDQDDDDDDDDDMHVMPQVLPPNNGGVHVHNGNVNITVGPNGVTIVQPGQTLVVNNGNVIIRN